MKNLSDEVPPGHGGPIHSVHQNDVLLPSSTRRSNQNSHSGNMYFQKMVASLKNDYADPRLSEMEREGIVGQLVAHIRGMQPEGRFLIEDGEREGWVEIGDEEARVMVADALRGCHHAEWEGEQMEQKLFEGVDANGATSCQLINHESSEGIRHPDWEAAVVAVGNEQAPTTSKPMHIHIHNESSSDNTEFVVQDDQGEMMTQPLQHDLRRMAAELSSTKNDLLHRLITQNEVLKKKNEQLCGQRHQLATQLSDAYQNIEEDKRVLNGVYVELERLRQNNDELRVQKERAESIADVARINQTIMKNTVKELNSVVARNEKVVASLTDQLQKFEQVEMIDSARGLKQSKRSSRDEGDRVRRQRGESIKASPHEKQGQGPLTLSESTNGKVKRGSRSRNSKN